MKLMYQEKELTGREDEGNILIRLLLFGKHFSEKG